MNFFDDLGVRSVSFSTSPAKCNRLLLFVFGGVETICSLRFFAVGTVINLSSILSVESKKINSESEQTN